MPPHERTLVHYSAKYINPTWGGRTVPAAIPELVLALRQRHEDRDVKNTHSDIQMCHEKVLECVK